MTSIAVELSVDQRGPCALYIVSDSRITWGGAQSRWDSGQKVFASQFTPDIFGFCGDAYFPPLILSQIISQIDAGILFSRTAPPAERHAKTVKLFQSAIRNSQNPPINSFTIFHGSREGEGMKSRFRLWRTRYEKNGRLWKNEELPVEEARSYLAAIDGSGAAHVRRSLSDSQTEPGTSRGAFRVFFDELKLGSDPLSGGAPQLVGMWRIGPGRHFGMIWNRKRYFCGTEVRIGTDFDNAFWFNEKFERADARTLSRLKDAKEH